MEQKDIENGRLVLVAQNRKAVIDANLFNQVLPRGDYVAQVEASDVIWRESPFGTRNVADLLLRIVCRNKWGVYKTTLQFRIYDLDQDKQERDREKVGDLGAAMGVYRFDDSDQLHGIPFALTVWNDWRDKPMRFTCRPMPEGRFQRWSAATGQRRLSNLLETMAVEEAVQLSAKYLLA